MNYSVLVVSLLLSWDVCSLFIVTWKHSKQSPPNKPRPEEKLLIL